MGKIYFYGFGRPKDIETGINWFSLAAEQGSPEAQFALGQISYSSKDYNKALEWLTPAAQQGNTGALNNLGVMYFKGQGLDQNFEAALNLYTLAAERGHGPSQISLGSMYFKGQGVTKDNIRAYMWMDIAATNGRANAVRNRDILAKKMTAVEISKAQALARECVKKNYKGC